MTVEEKHLRFHSDWVNGEWIQPKNRHRILPDTWVPGLFIKKSAEKDEGGGEYRLCFLVKCPGLGSLDNAINVNATKENVVIVDLQHIRPSPQCQSRTDYELQDHVDGWIAESWQKGLITKVTKGKYTVSLQQRKEDKEFSFKELRPHLDWVDGEWKEKSKVQSKGLVNTERRRRGDNISAAKLQLTVVPVISKKTPCSSTTRTNMDHSTISAEMSASDVFPSSNKKVKVNSDMAGKKVTHCDTLMIEGDAGEAPLSVKRIKESSTQRGTSSKLQKERRRDKQIQSNLAGMARVQLERVTLPNLVLF